MIRARRSLVAGLLVAVALIASGCTDDEPSRTPSSVPPPWGLEATPLPENQSDIDALLAAMPTDLAGSSGVVEGNEIGYGAGGMGEMAGSMETFLRVMTLGGEDYGTGAAFIEAIAQNGGIRVEGQDLDPDAPVVYLAGVTPAGDMEYASVMWADPGSRYVLLIQATSREQRAALVSAYQDAAASALG